MKIINKKLIGCGAAIAITAALVASGGVAANASGSPTPAATVAQPTPGSSAAAKAPSSKYSDEEIVGLFVFGAGRAATEHPEIVAKYVKAPLPDTTSATIADLTSQLRAANPRFHEQVTIPLQSNDAESILAAQIAFRSALQQITSTAPPVADGKGLGRCGLFVAAAGAVVIVVAVAGGAVVQTLVAVNVNWVWAYTQPGGSTEFSRQVKAADIASEL